MGSFLRRPLGLFAAIVVVGVIVIGVGMKAFGSTSPASPYSATPISAAQFARVGEHACASLRRQLKAVTHRKPGSLTEAARSVRRITSIVDGVRTELYGVIPPPAAGVPFRRLLANLDTADRALHRLNGLTDTGQWQRAKMLVRSRGWRKIGKRMGSSAKRADLRCSRARRTNAIFAAVGMRAAGSTSSASYYFAKPLTPEQFARAGQRICVSVRGQLERIVALKPRSPEEAGQMIERLTSLLDGFAMELRGLTPPRSFEAPWRRVLSDIAREERAMHNLNQLGMLGEWRRAVRLVRSSWWQAMLERLGPPVKPADIRCG